MFWTLHVFCQWCILMINNPALCRHFIARGLFPDFICDQFNQPHQCILMFLKSVLFLLNKYWCTKRTAMLTNYICKIFVPVESISWLSWCPSRSSTFDWLTRLGQACRLEFFFLVGWFQIVDSLNSQETRIYRSWCNTIFLITGFSFSAKGSFTKFRSWRLALSDLQLTLLAAGSNTLSIWPGLEHCMQV